MLCFRGFITKKSVDLYGGATMVLQRLCTVPMGSCRVFMGLGIRLFALVKSAFPKEVVGCRVTAQV